MDKLKKFVAFGDLQGEDEVLRKILPFLRDYRPDEVVIGGDFLEFNAISSYTQHERRSKGITQVLKETREEIMKGREMLSLIRYAVGSRCKITFIAGNHEERLEKFFLEYPQLFEEYCTLEEALEFKKRNISPVKLGGFYNIGKLYFIHGEGYGSDLFTKAVALKCRKNVRVFHHHTNQSYMLTSELDGDEKIEVKAVGCMCGMSPSFMAGQQNRWINSFLCGYSFPNGDFQDFTVNVIRGRFVAPNGKVYGNTRED